MKKNTKCLRLKHAFVSGLLVGLICGAAPVSQGDENFAYKLALINAQTVNSERYFSNKPQTPDAAAVSEFRWILQSIQDRSINSPRQIADTIVETWGVLKKRNVQMPLLDCARELSNTARNTRLFGSAPVDFRITSKYWVMSQISKQDIKTILEQNPYPK